MTIFKKDLGLYPAPIDKMARPSVPGMAHFAGTGPAGECCKSCAFWDRKKPDDVEAPCKKYKALTNRIGKQVPDVAAACRHYVRRA